MAPGSAAAAAGLKPGDVITEVNGEPIARSGALSSLIGMSAPGEKVKLKVWRDKAARDIEAKLGGADDRPTQAGRWRRRRAGPGHLGLALRAADAARSARGQGRAGPGGRGASAAPAARAGIEPGDVLLAINGKPVQSVEQVRGVLQGKPKSVALLVQRDGEKIFVPVKLG